MLAGGALFVGAKGSSVNAVIGNGGRERVASGGSAIGTTISGSGVMEAVDGGVLGSGTSLTFAGTGGTLQVDDTTMPTAVISGFAPGDTLAFTRARPDPDPGRQRYRRHAAPGQRASAHDPGHLLRHRDNTICNSIRCRISTASSSTSRSAPTRSASPAAWRFSSPAQAARSVSGGTTFVSNGVTSTGAVVESGGVLVVLSGGTALDTTINSGGSEIVSAGGADGARRSPAANRTCSARRAA